MNLSVKFMGMSLPNPVVAAASTLTATTKAVEKVLDTGVGAVILESLFEEDIVAQTDGNRKKSPSIHPEADNYMNNTSMLLEADQYLATIEECTAMADVPIIASLNCYSERWWVDYAKMIANVGADAIELNLSSSVIDERKKSREIEDSLVRMVSLARKAVSLPLLVKIGSWYTALPNLAHKIKRAGADGLTLFNRHYKMDINIETMTFKGGQALSAPEEFFPVLRWLGILAASGDLDLSASTGIYSGENSIKALLSGANTVQLCSALYKNGVETIKNILVEIEEWMREHNYSKVEDFQGRMKLQKNERDQGYQRLQYVKAFKSMDN